MLRISIMACCYGLLTFLGLASASLIASNYLDLDPTRTPFSFVYLAAWILPGYVAARIAGRNGVSNGAIVGVVAALVAGVIVQLFFNSPPPGVESSGGDSVGLVVAVGSVTLCALGGLVWELQRLVRKRDF